MDSENEMFLSVGDQHGIPAEPVDDHIGKTAVEPKFYGGGFTVEHLEEPVGIFGQLFAGKLGAGGPGLVADTDVLHPVHPVGSDTVAGRMGQQIAVFVVLAKTVGTGFVLLFPVIALAV